MVTERVRIGHMVVCTGFRNPALTAKLSSTIDVISGGRFELGHRCRAGRRTSGSPTATASRRRTSGSPSSATTSRSSAGCSPRAARRTRASTRSVDGAINEPKGLQQPRIPIIVGGNGPNVTMRLAARFADELNLVFRPIDEIPGLMATARQRCEEIDRDPATLRLSLYIADTEVREEGPRRVDLLGQLAEVGLDRLVAFPTRYGATREVQASFADDCRAAGLLGEAAAPAALG